MPQPSRFKMGSSQPTQLKIGESQPLRLKMGVAGFCAINILCETLRDAKKLCRQFVQPRSFRTDSTKIQRYFPRPNGHMSRPTLCDQLE